MQQEIMNVINDLAVPEHMSPLYVLIKNNTNSLHNLLFLNNGPLQDGYQEKEWISICILISSWMVSLNPEINTDVFKEITPTDMAVLSIDIVIMLIRKNVIVIEPESEKQIVLAVLNNISKIVITLIIKNLNKISFSFFNCCFPTKGKINKIIQKQLDDCKINNTVINGITSL